jgi:hypothetical protein
LQQQLAERAIANTGSQSKPLVVDQHVAQCATMRIGDIVSPTLLLPSGSLSPQRWTPLSMMRGYCCLLRWASDKPVRYLADGGARASVAVQGQGGIMCFNAACGR